jgi:hypothetical protein
MSNQSTPSKEAPSMSQAQAAPDPFREFVDEDTVTSPEAPTGDIDSLQLISSTARIWFMRTKHPLSAVLANSYWESLKDCRVMKEDVVQLVSSYGSDQAEHSVLVVHSSDKHGLATVRVLHRYLRAAA